LRPTVFVNIDGRKACRIVYVDRIIEEHKASLKEDYDRIQSVALQEMKVSILNEWKKNVLKETYIDIKEDFDCRWNDNWKK
jgi:peptidyl-prolyl cis-trans isomerase SurA